MASSILIAALAAGLEVFAPYGSTADAQLVPASGDCGAAAADAAAQTGGEVLSAEPSGNGSCVVTVLVQGKNGRPKKMKIRVPM